MWFNGCGGDSDGISTHAHQRPCKRSRSCPIRRPCGGARGLTLTDGDVRSICAACERALRESNRIELEPGLPEALVEAFGSSPWLDPAAETLGALAELFYILKNETHDRISDESLLRWMREAFDGPCRGSVERLADLLGGGLYGGGE